MNQYQLRVNDGKCTDNLLDASTQARGVFFQDVLLENRHQAWNLIGSRKGKTVYDEIGFPVFPSPRENSPKPNSMNPADIVCRELMSTVIAINQLGHCAELFLQLGTVHLALPGDAKEITKNPAVRSRLVLPFHEADGLVPAPLLYRSSQ
jgi:hypothetical protein